MFFYNLFLGSSRCDRHWSLYRDTCYKASIVGQKKTWTQCRGQCKQYRGQLAIVKTKDVLMEVNRLLDTELARNAKAVKRAAVGMKQVGNWVWINGQNVSGDVINVGDAFDDLDCGSLHHRHNGGGGYGFVKKKCKSFGFYICESHKREFKE